MTRVNVHMFFTLSIRVTHCSVFEDIIMYVVPRKHLFINSEEMYHHHMQSDFFSIFRYFFLKSSLRVLQSIEDIRIILIFLYKIIMYCLVLIFVVAGVNLIYRLQDYFSWLWLSSVSNTCAREKHKWMEKCAAKICITCDGSHPCVWLKISTCW